MKASLKHTLGRAVIVTASIGYSMNTSAAEYPERPVIGIVPFAAGSSTDLLARRVSAPLAKSLGQQVIIENKPGADGRIGIEAMTKSAPDGYTILFAGQALTLIPALRKNVPWDPNRQVQPVAELGQSPYIIAVNSSVPVRNLVEFINLAKKHSGKLNASAGGNGTEMSLALFQLRTGSRVETISYKGTGLAALAVATGEVDFAIMDASAWVAAASSGRVRLLAVADDKRIAAFPNVPTAQEAGLPEFKAGTLFGVYTTGGAPINIVRRLNAEINKIIVTPEIAKGLAQQGLDPNPKSVDTFTQQYASDIAKWKDVVNRAKIPTTD